MEFHTSYHAYLKTGLQCFQIDNCSNTVAILYCMFFELSSCLHFAHSEKLPKMFLPTLLTIAQMHFPSAPLSKQ